MAKRSSKSFWGDEVDEDNQNNIYGPLASPLPANRNVRTEESDGRNAKSGTNHSTHNSTQSEAESEVSTSVSPPATASKAKSKKMSRISLAEISDGSITNEVQTEIPVIQPALRIDNRDDWPAPSTGAATNGTVLVTEIKRPTGCKWNGQNPLDFLTTLKGLALDPKTTKVVYSRAERMLNHFKEMHDTFQAYTTAKDKSSDNIAELVSDQIANIFGDEDPSDSNGSTVSLDQIKEETETALAIFVSKVSEFSQNICKWISAIEVLSKSKEQFPTISIFMNFLSDFTESVIKTLTSYNLPNETGSISTDLQQLKRELVAFIPVSEREPHIPNSNALVVYQQEVSPFNSRDITGRVYTLVDRLLSGNSCKHPYFRIQEYEDITEHYILERAHDAGLVFTKLNDVLRGVPSWERKDQLVYGIPHGFKSDHCQHVDDYGYTICTGTLGKCGYLHNREKSTKEFYAHVDEELYVFLRALVQTFPFLFGNTVKTAYPKLIACCKHNTTSYEMVKAMVNDMIKMHEDFLDLETDGPAARTSRPVTGGRVRR